MSEVYYRKWRPRRLDDVVGQEPVTRTLRQAVALDRVAHAYLFCGPRGTGKTSTARILAKAVNCLAPQEGEPDNECAVCRSINEGRALDLIEIDAASNRGIDDIRELSERVRFTPGEARYKVYIIDEVHMLTEPAFNALLKTLEEPPAHAIFVLATTESHKVPPTVISRCQRFDFRRIPMGVIVQKLGQLCDGEGIEAAAAALTLIARTAQGSLRDAENLLEQAVVSYGSPLSDEQIRDLLGLGGDETALDLTEHTIRGSVPEALTVIDQVAGQGSDLRQLHTGTVEYLRAVLLVKTGVGMPPGYPEDTAQRIGALAKSGPMENILHALKTFSEVDLRRDSSSSLPIELAVVESAGGPPARAREPAAGVQAAGVQAAGPRAASPPGPPSHPQPARERPGPRTASPAPRQAPRPAPTAGAGSVPQALPSEPAARLDAQWRLIIRALRHTGKRFNLGALLRGCNAREVDDSRITLKFPFASHVERMQQELNDPETRRALSEAVSGLMDGTYEIRVELAGDGDGRPAQKAADTSHMVRSARTMGAHVVDEKEDAP